MTSLCVAGKSMLLQCDYLVVPVWLEAPPGQINHYVCVVFDFSKHNIVYMDSMGVRSCVKAQILTVACHDDVLYRPCNESVVHHARVNVQML